MKRTGYLGGLFVWLGLWASSGQAGCFDFLGWWQGGAPLGPFAPWPCCKCGCPDDYCPKPLPAPPPLSKCGCDDYCPKPFPAPPPRTCLGPCDDYSPKPRWIWTEIGSGPWYQCGRSCGQQCAPPPR